MAIIYCIYNRRLLWASAKDGHVEPEAVESGNPVFCMQNALFPFLILRIYVCAQRLILASCYDEAYS